MPRWAAVAGAVFLLFFAVTWFLFGRYCTKRSNCVFWAGDQWSQYGGWVSFRPSDWGWLPHCMWSPDLKTWYGYVPIADLPPYGWFPNMFFEGRVEAETRG